MDHADEMELKLLETARRSLMEKQGALIGGLVKTSQFRSLETWLDDGDDAPLHQAVRHASARQRVDLDEQTYNRLVASLRYRVLTGSATSTLPVRIDDPNDHPGLCGNLKYQPDRGCWDCAVNNRNQATADKWHQTHGYSPACPFWTLPNPEAVRDAGEETYDSLDDFVDPERLLE